MMVLCTTELHVIFVLNSGSYESSHTFDGAFGPIFMDYVNCTGSEVRLWDCVHFTHSYGCDHSHDAGVRCQPGELYIIILE